MQRFEIWILVKLQETIPNNLNTLPTQSCQGMHGPGWFDHCSEDIQPDTTKTWPIKRLTEKNTSY